MRRPVVLIALLIASFLAASPRPARASGRRASDRRASDAQELPAPPPAEAAPAGPLVIPRGSGAVRIDGILDEPIWSTAVSVPLPYEIQPGDNITPPVLTECLVTYDDERLYVAFRAHDPNPGAIRANLSDRDFSSRDDMVGIFLDTFNDERRGIELFVNPLGVQSDGLRNDVGGGDQPEDSSWDAIWDSAGRIVDDGYQVEMAIPFSSLRFPQRDGPQTWGFLAFRAWPRSSRHQIMSQRFDRNRSCFLCQAGKITGFEGIVPGGRIELDPTLTARRDDVRDDIPTGPLETGSIDPEVGLTARFAMTPNLILNGTVNPDFSQVEADVAQLTENNRFALFYPEKRPFFLESADVFSTPITAIYTRTVVDPSWGVKLSGKTGTSAIGVAYGQDEVTSLLLPSNQSSDVVTIEQANRPAVARYRADVGKGSTLGLLYAGREGEEYSNRLYGADGLWRLTGADTIRFQYLRTSTRYPDAFAIENEQPTGRFSGDGLDLHYDHNSRGFNAWVGHRDLARGFRADTGFVPRVDVKRDEAGAEKVWFGDQGAFFNRILAGAYGSRATDESGLLTDTDFGPHIEMRMPRQSFLFARYSRGSEFFDGVTYDGQDRGELFFNARWTGSFTSSVQGNFGDAVDHDNGGKGRLFHVVPGITWDFGRHLHLQLDHAYERLNVDGGTLYRANLTQARLVYQFTVRAFARAIVQRTAVNRQVDLYVDPETEAESRDLLTQFLFSYKVNPQTLAYIGYSDTRSNEGGVDVTVNERGFFFKIGYAWLP